MGGLAEFFGFGGGDAGASAAQQAGAQTQLGIDELRRQFDVTQQNIQPFIGAGQAALPGLEQGATAGGLDERLAQIFGTDIFKTLRGERTRAAEGQLAAGGLTRSGTALETISDIPTQLGLQLEQLLTGRLGNLASGGQNAALGLGQLGGQTAGGIANLFQQKGQDISAGALTDAQARAAANQNIIQTGTDIASVFFSDPSLKENVEPIGVIGDLQLYEWDWLEETKGTLIEKCGTVGFMADEVEELYPQHVGEFGGFMVIDYPALLSELEAKKWSH